VLVLICRILETYTGDYNSSAICFGHNNERYCSPPDVVVVNASTAQLRFANMSLGNSGHFNCELPDLKGQWHAQQSVTVASEYIYCSRPTGRPLFTHSLVHWPSPTVVTLVRLTFIDQIKRRGCSRRSWPRCLTVYCVTKVWLKSSEIYGRS